MKGMLIYGDDFTKAEGLNMCWQKGTTADAASANLFWEARCKMIITKPNPVGAFSFCMPLKHLFGFCDDYEGDLWCEAFTAAESESDNDTIFRDKAVAAGRITLSKLSWLMPQ